MLSKFVEQLPVAVTPPPKPVQWPDMALLRWMHAREDQLRVCAVVQRAFTEAEECQHTNWMCVVANLQEFICLEAGATQLVPLECAVNLFRSRMTSFPKEQCFQQAIQYRYNKNREGEMQIGDEVVDVRLSDMAGEPVQLRSGWTPKLKP